MMIRLLFAPLAVTCLMSLPVQGGEVGVPDLSVFQLSLTQATKRKLSFNGILTREQLQREFEMRGHRERMRALGLTNMELTQIRRVLGTVYRKATEETPISNLKFTSGLAYVLTDWFESENIADRTQGGLRKYYAEVGDQGLLRIPRVGPAALEVIKKYLRVTALKSKAQDPNLLGLARTAWDDCNEEMSGTLH